MISTDLRVLVPGFQRAYDACLREDPVLMSKVRNGQTYRSEDVQFAYYAQGRDDYAGVCDAYRKAGLEPPTEPASRIQITWTLCSYHTIYRAVDMIALPKHGYANATLLNAALARLFAKHGIIQPLPDTDPWHFEYHGV